MSYDASSSPSSSLADRRNELTRELIVKAALDTLERASVGELTVRAVAKSANISERTIFRYFPTRDEFLDAIAAELGRVLDLPPPPRTIEELKLFPRVLYRRFETRRNLTTAALHSELFHRMRESQAKQRWAVIRKLIDELSPRCPARTRRIAAGNIRYYLAASTWHYYRVYMQFTLDDTVACAEAVIRDALNGLRQGDHC
jgi:AcrR family transcriptional regulator